MVSTPQTEQVSIENVIDTLKQQFPQAISDDSRDGYQGIVIDKNQLVQVAAILRDSFGFDYLSNAAAVDYLGIADEMEMVYHVYRTTGGSGLSFKVKTERENAEIPSLVPVWAGANFQEREAWDLFGIRFTQHPNMRRILTWEGFYGHPLRKDWKEPYYEEEHKPFDSRWPGGHVFRNEERNVYGKNVQYPPDFDIADLEDESEEAVYDSMQMGVGVQQLPRDDNGLDTDKLVVNMGPHHPSTHGVFRMVLTLDGEKIVNLEPVMGYMHRNHEQIGERNTWLHNIPYTDRLDYLASMSNNQGYVTTVEQLLSTGSRYEPPTYRAEVIRVLMVELTRIASHLWSIGFWLNDLGAFFTPSLYFLNEREKILDFFEATAGSRLMCNYMRFGGISMDLPEQIRTIPNLINDRMRDYNTMEFLSELILERLPKVIDDLEDITDNEIVRERSIGVSTLAPEVAIAYSISGPVLRSTGVAYDVRRADPYSIYPELDFEVVTGQTGDLYDRYRVRVGEIRESIRILEQILPRLEETQGQPIFPGGKATAYTVTMPVGEAYGRVENPRGELGFYVVSNDINVGRGTQNPWRYHVRAPSFINLTALGLMCEGYTVADAVAILGSIDIVVCETDR